MQAGLRLSGSVFFRKLQMIPSAKDICSLSCTTKQCWVTI